MSKESLRVILVHGSSHGAWCWYKLITALRSKGYYRVTAIDLAASGIDTRKIPEDISTFEEYNRVLMELLLKVSEGEKVILVGHSFGGMNLAFAMDKFSEKIAAAIFITAYLPDIVHNPFYVVEKALQRHLNQKIEYEFRPVEVPGKSEPFKILCLDSKVLATYFYQNSSSEDLTLANMLMRPTSMFDHIRENQPFKEEGFGSVDKIYIICDEDAIVNEEFQRWMIHNNGNVKEILEIKGADHMPMFSKTQELCQLLINIIDKYSA